MIYYFAPYAKPRKKVDVKIVHPIKSMAIRRKEVDIFVNENVANKRKIINLTIFKQI